MEPEAPEAKLDEVQAPAEVFTLEVPRERVESLWRQALNQKGSGRADLAAARANRTNAELERQRISNEALEATRQACGKLIEETERQLKRAREAEAEAVQKLTESENDLRLSKQARSEAEAYRDKLMEESHREGQRIRDDSRATAMHECEELKCRAAYEVQSMLSEIEAMKEAAQEEIEVQRIYAELATIKAMSHDVRAGIVERVDSAMVAGGNGNTNVTARDSSGRRQVTRYEENGAGPDRMPASPVAMPVATKNTANGMPHDDAPAELESVTAEHTVAKTDKAPRKAAQ